MNVYAYGIKACCGKNHYIHYWIDENLQYGEKISDSHEIKDVSWIRGSQFKVDLTGRGEYTITSLPLSPQIIQRGCA